MTKETKKTPVAGTAAGVNTKEENTALTTQDPNKELDNLKAENSALKEKVEALESELNQVKKHYEDLEGQNESLNDQLKMLEEESERYKEGSMFLKGKIAEKDAIIAELQKKEADTEKLIYTSDSGDKYEVTQSEFRFMGTLYQSADAIDNHRNVMETLIESKSFILKQA